MGENTPFANQSRQKERDNGQDNPLAMSVLDNPLYIAYEIYSTFEFFPSINIADIFESLFTLNIYNGMVMNWTFACLVCSPFWWLDKVQYFGLVISS